MIRENIFGIGYFLLLALLLFNWELGLVNLFGMKPETQLLLFGLILVSLPCFFLDLTKDLTMRDLVRELSDNRTKAFSIAFAFSVALLLLAWLLGLLHMVRLLADDERMVFGGILLGLLGLKVIEDYANRKGSVQVFLRSVPWRTILVQYVLLLLASYILAWAFGLIDLDRPTRNLSRVAAFPIAAMLLGYSYKIFFIPGRRQK